MEKRGPSRISELGLSSVHARETYFGGATREYGVSVMRMFSTLLAGIAGLALVAGAPFSSQAQEGSSKSWGPKHTTFWSSDSTGSHDPGKFMQQPSMGPSAIQPTADPGQQQMNYQPTGKRVTSQMRVRQPQTRLRQQQPAKPPMKQGTQPPPTERSDQPPSDAKPSAPPSQGEPPARGQQPTTPGAQPK
jgi:hypothetical protein